MPPGKNSVERFSTPKSNCVFLSLWKYTTLCAWCQFFWGVFLSFSDIPRIFKRAAEIFGGIGGGAAVGPSLPPDRGNRPLDKGSRPPGRRLAGGQRPPLRSGGNLLGGRVRTPAPTRIQERSHSPRRGRSQIGPRAQCAAHTGKTAAKFPKEARKIPAVPAKEQRGSNLQKTEKRLLLVRGFLSPGNGQRKFV